ncbi:MAG TPA: hypothetical protein VHB18_13080 [Mycobacteriales bacterium]|jgi:hypothetical protein|nr:hypothetical protein [Mycobacteriales bacterium]
MAGVGLSSESLPLHLGRPLRLAIEYLKHPDTSLGALTDFGTLPIRPQRRTRVAHFEGVS